MQQRVLEGKIAIVTGAASPRGLGRAMTEALVKAGARVSMMDINQQWLDETSNYMREIGGDDCVMTQIVDVSSIGDVERSIERTIEELGGLQILVNNAGIQPVEPFDALTAAAWDEVLTVDLRATQVLTAAAATFMHDGGAVVNIAPIEAHQPAAGHAHYAAAKAGLVMATRAAALELGPSGIRINSVSPGLIDDGRLAERWPEGVDRWLAAAPLGRLGTPEDVADAVSAMASLAFKSTVPAAVILSQRLIGAKSFQD